MAGGQPLPVAGVCCGVGRLDARRGRFRALLAGASPGDDRTPRRQPAARRYRQIWRPPRDDGALGLGLRRVPLSDPPPLYPPRAPPPLPPPRPFPVPPPP